MMMTIHKCAIYLAELARSGDVPNSKIDVNVDSTLANLSVVDGATKRKELADVSVGLAPNGDQTEHIRLGLCAKI
jgi:hypothetical protein